MCNKVVVVVLGVLYSDKIKYYCIAHIVILYIHVVCVIHYARVKPRFHLPVCAYVCNIYVIANGPVGSGTGDQKPSGVSVLRP